MFLMSVCLVWKLPKSRCPSVVSEGWTLSRNGRVGTGSRPTQETRIISPQPLAGLTPQAPPPAPHQEEGLQGERDVEVRAVPTAVQWPLALFHLRELGAVAQDRNDDGQATPSHSDAPDPLSTPRGIPAPDLLSEQVTPREGAFPLRW